MSLRTERKPATEFSVWVEKTILSPSGMALFELLGKGFVITSGGYGMFTPRGRKFRHAVNANNHLPILLTLGYVKKRHVFNCKQLTNYVISEAGKAALENAPVEWRKAGRSLARTYIWKAVLAGRRDRNWNKGLRVVGGAA